MRSTFSLLSVFLLFVSAASALKFNLPAQPKGSHPRCVRDFVTKGTLVVVNVKTNGQEGDGQELIVTITDNAGNDHGGKAVLKKSRMAFTAPRDASFDVCFENIHTNTVPNLYREVELDVEIGANARDWNALQASERLKPTERELRRIEELADEVHKELEYLKIRETRLRDTNESTNRRVKLFSMGIILSLVALGGWQIIYLRNYFRSKHII
ncbi:hypothetical protein NADFUDRAFT_69289 [Nadsonia fulvescens var. elongata DSM 6958]|uniref:GOLD domain-containing protein n=1 Tax=Nadsonia fulvescens var. elongata DSM 6958 TaxID=857566 RepID=A0A1E3PQH7_9ASCO|nr:hypothetical protein NADFUDRAFT_69289 [Nadsonia fulvescens var. elongata DSM 6958]